jgi:hypothetical protein
MAPSPPRTLGERSLGLSTKDEVISTLKGQLQAFHTVWKNSRDERGPDDFTQGVGMYIIQLTSRLEDLEAMDHLPIDILILHTFAKQHPALQPRTVEATKPQLAPVAQSNMSPRNAYHQNLGQTLDPYASLPNLPREHVLVNPNSGEIVSPRIAPNPAVNLHPAWERLQPRQHPTQGRE